MSVKQCHVFFGAQHNPYRHISIASTFSGCKCVTNIIASGAIVHAHDERHHTLLLPSL